jgi:transcription antitermination protein NusB
MKRLAREIALQILFQTEFSQRISTDDFLGLFEESVPKEALEYADSLIKGIKDHQTAIDTDIQSSSAHWSLSRMSLVDRNILRISIFEMKYANTKTKPSIVINEAVEIAKKFGTSDSGAFVNGILDTIAQLDKKP